MRKDNRHVDASLVSMIFVVLFVSNWQRCCAQIDSVICNFQDFNYLTAYTEANYAAYPSIIEHGHTANCQKLKENVKDSLMSGAWGIEQAVHLLHCPWRRQLHTARPGGCRHHSAADSHIHSHYHQRRTQVCEDRPSEADEMILKTGYRQAVKACRARL